MGKITFGGFRKLAKQHNINSYTVKIRNDINISQSTLQRLREDHVGVTTNTIAELCRIFHCQPGDLMEYIEDDSAADQEQKDGD